MSSYISSNANRFYAALEGAYGQVAAITAEHRIPAVKLAITQRLDGAERKDKTGSRTFPGSPGGGRRRTNFELRTYLTTWAKAPVGPEAGPESSITTPCYGPLVETALGGPRLEFTGGLVASSTAGGRLGFETPHGLEAGQAVACAGEIRFASAIVDERSVQLNAPFATQPAPGAALSAAITYTPGMELPSATIFDYWSPATAAQRLLRGAAADEMEILVNGDYHELRFRGLAQDVVDSCSITNELAEFPGFPEEPELSAFDYSIVPGHMGQAWLGAAPTQMFTLTAASVVIKNNLDTRSKEFGSRLPRAIVPGQRTVTASFD